MVDRNASKFSEAVGMPSYITVPPVSMHRKSANIRVDFPDPVLPTSTCVSVSLIQRATMKTYQLQFVLQTGH